MSALLVAGLQHGQAARERAQAEQTARKMKGGFWLCPLGESSTQVQMTKQTQNASDKTLEEQNVAHRKTTTHGKKPHNRKC